MLFQMLTTIDRWRGNILVAFALIGAYGIAPAYGCEAPGSSVKLPTIAELEQRGAKVGAIEIKVEDIFDATKPGEDATL